MARLALGLAGLATGAFTVQLMRDGVWTRAEVVADELRTLEDGVPGLDSNPTIKRDTFEGGALEEARKYQHHLRTRVWNDTVRQAVGPGSWLGRNLAPRKGE
mmetsp:Transcript_65699/g.158860  ORF Transcript_65699/g.158860 Transcript_65699/m.158860 type:complete len:102 (-) Transcript_65699:85-390(-)